uniref:Reverse transcriptase Ty1/copia-type domain-containing protein n=1 Tax=Nicotiana tabacum TaxID=4097 RepID=A0A1S3XSX2_TOBAC|nr:PREDICTED: uncharacterized protein LOC107768191 [Nicotiana tabacum]
MWYNCLSEYLLKKGYKNDHICPCVFIKRSGSEFVIIDVYVDDLNIIGTSKELPNVVDCLKIEFEMKDLDNAACIAQLKGGYIKGDITKHISPKFFFTHDLQQNSEINVQQIRSCENLDDLFTKALLTSTFEKLRQKIGMRRLREIK